VKDDVINNLLNSNTMNHGIEMIPRKYSDLIEGQFEIQRGITNKPQNDEYTISNKILDFSAKTIKQLRESGYSNSIDLSGFWLDE
jgi:NTE family protein